MKRLGVFACISILFIGLFASFSTSAFAQGIDRQTTSGSGTVQATQKSISEYEAKGKLLFDNAIAELNRKKQNPTATGTTPTTVQVIDALIAAVNSGSQTFISTLNSGTDSNALRYERALYAARDNISQSQRTNPALLRTPYANNFISTFARQLSDEANAERRATGMVSGGYTQEEADRDRGGTENARNEGTAAAAAGKQANPASCNLWDGNLLDCIGQLITWVIKNTLLQIAGFLVWLTANMLNYAIQVGILGFKDFAADGLYPIWLVIRQIVSLAVVFAGLYLGFMYIIGREDTFARYVGWIVLFAIFVNFSYPITRAVTDISNIVSLNVYTAAVGSQPLTTAFTTSATTLGGNTPGSLIMNRLGLSSLIASATEVNSRQTDIVKNINTVPGALIAVAFVLYAAYIFFMATAIIAVRTAVLVFLIVASPLLLIDSVVPKLGEVAMKMRKVFFEQLAVAPVFMIMLALTLKFMEIFGTGSGPLASAGATGAGGMAGGAAALASGTGTSVPVFFSILIMLIMLHIMIKVTKHISGEAGAFATNLMGKVGGFGLGVATAGTGLLARGTIGQLAARAGASQTMDRWKSTAIGRGVYGLTNSLANSTFDARNIGMVQRGMASAGLTGGLGITMQKGGTRGFSEEQQAREKKVLEFGSNIRDDATRASYFRNANKGFVYAKVDEAKIRETEREAKERKESQISAILSESDPEKRKSIIDKALIAKDYALADRLRTGDEFHGIDNTDPEAAKKKADILKKMGIDNAKFAQDLIKKDPFKDIADAHEKLVKQLKEDADKINRKTPEGEAAYRDMQAKIGEANAEFRQKKDKLIKETFEAYTGVSIGTGDVDVPLPLDGSKGTIDPLHPGGSDKSTVVNVVPAVQRRAVEGSETRELTPDELQKMNTGFDMRTRSAVDIARMSRNGGNSPQGSSSDSSSSTSSASTI